MADKQRQFLIRAAYFAALAALTWLAARYVLVWLLPFALALGLAALAEPGIERVRRTMRLKRGFVAAVFTLGLVGGLTALAIFVAGQLVRQADEILGRLPAYLASLPDLGNAVLRRLDEFSAACPAGLRQDVQQLVEQLPERLGDAAGELSAAALRWMAAAVAALPHAALFCATTALAVFFSVGSYPAIAAFFRRQMGPKQRAWVAGLRDNLFATLGKWLKAQAILLALTFAQLLAGFALLRQPYALLLAFLIALIDALPVFGTGTVLLPWAALLLLVGNVPRALALAALYAVIALVRSVTEPRIMAAQVGLPPLAALGAMYVGFRTMGVGGMVLLPMGALLLKQLHDAGYVKLWR